MTDAVKTYIHKGYKISIFRDDDAENPRDWDNLGTMLHWHRRSNIGDKRITPGDTLFLEEGGPNGETEMINADDMDDLAQKIREAFGGCEVIPVYLYEHGGQTISAGSFGDPWDSGQVGMIYVSYRRIKAECAKQDPNDPNKLLPLVTPEEIQAKAHEILLGEIETFDQFLTGDVYGYDIEKVPTDDEDYDEDAEVEFGIDSCWGFFGMDYCKEEAESMVDYYVEKDRKQAVAEEERKQAALHDRPIEAE